MSDVVQQTQPEFWSPPAPAIPEPLMVREIAPTLAEACNRCGTEFLLGSRFCHTCGGRRQETISPAARADAVAIAGIWEEGVRRLHQVVVSLGKIKAPSWLRYLQFHEIKSRVGLSTASLVAFFIGLGCVAGALLVGLLTAKTLVDWQAIQLYRIEWLMAATASFVAGILLKKKSSPDKE